MIKAVAFSFAAGLVVGVLLTAKLSGIVSRANPVNAIGSVITGDPNYQWTGFHL